MRNPYKALYFVAVVIIAMISLASIVRAGQDKVTICHASGLAGTTKFETLTIAYPAVFGQAGHFYENGTPRAGHEQDYLGPCVVVDPTPDPTVEPTVDPTVEPTVQPTPEPSFVQCDGEVQVPELTECPTPSETPVPTQSIGEPATATPTPRNVVPNTAMDSRPFGVSLFGWIGGILFLLAVLVYATMSSRKNR